EQTGLVGGAVRFAPLQDLYTIAALFLVADGERILDRLRDPEPAVLIEVHVDRLANIRLGGDQLNVQAGRQVEALALLFRRPRRRAGDIWVIGDCMRRTKTDEGEREQNENDEQRSHPILHG